MTHSQSSAAPAASGDVFFILVTVVLDMLSFGIIIPVLPKLVEDFFGGDTRAEPRRSMA
jgi:DHA1 family tetracycline resistance protein-like MFS transporter